MSETGGAQSAEPLRNFHEGVAAFNAGRYFDAHEFFEEIWQQLPKEDSGERGLYQGLIQLAVALHHSKNGNPQGFHSVLEKACNNFAQFRKHGKLPSDSFLKTIDVDEVMVQAFLLETEPDDNTLVFKLKTKTPGR